MASRDKATNQIEEFKKNEAGKQGTTTTSFGMPVDDNTNSVSAGARGPLMLQDLNLIDTMAHFDRERIPERVVHAKGAGAFGYFQVTHDVSDICKAAIFNKVGKETPVAVRFSTVGGESGSADTARDPRGFAIKHYTEEGNWDLVGNNTPIFFIRDPILFPSFIHTQKRNPATHLKDPDMFWDFITLRPETCHQVSFLFSDRGTPNGYRFMNGYGSHTFKAVNDKNESVYVKFHYKCDQGIKNFFREEADDMASKDPDYAIRDLYNAIADNNFPSWTMHIQVMTFEEAEKFEFNPFDLTKVWSQKQYPLRQVGKLVLNRNPSNYFAEVEQLAFSPAHMVPGIEASPDKMLQGRLFSYNDTHRHRLGANFEQIPVNCPYKTKISNYQRDGPMTVNGNQAGAPNYFPNSFNGCTDKKDTACQSFKVSGDVQRFDSSNEDNFTQCGIFFREVLNDKERERLVDNIASHLCNAQGFLQERAINNFGQADKKYGEMLRDRLKHYNTPSSNNGLSARV